MQLQCVALSGFLFEETNYKNKYYEMTKKTWTLHISGITMNSCQVLEIMVCLY